jgi:valyl-tRNA synthetase
MRDMAAARNAANETQKEILTLLNKHDQESSNEAEFGRGTTMNDIEQTQRVIHNFEADLATHKGKKQKLVVNIGDDKNDDRIQKLDKAIKSTKSMIKISRAQLKRQMDEMGKTMKGLDNSSDEEDSK